MKILCIGDPHASLKSLSDIELLGNKLLDLIKNEHPDKIVILGDLSNDFEKIHTLVLREIVRFFEKLLIGEIPVIYLVGNHCLINNSCYLEDAHAFTPFKKWHDTKLLIVDKLIMDEHGFLYLPYVPPGRFMEAIGDTDLTKITAVFCHQEFIGAKMGVIESKHGDHWPPHYPLAVSGHIHEYGRLRPNILYVGAPMMHTFADSPDKTVSLITFNDDGGYIEQRIDLDMPKKITMDVKVEELGSVIIPENSKTRVNLIANTTEEMRATKKTKEYAELAKVAKIVPIILSPASAQNTSRAKSTYLDILQESVKKEGGDTEELFVEVHRDAISLK
jgi:DNA repair exonuclease SbcCD nuclease subunit